jgi:hypothetical protein
MKPPRALDFSINQTPDNLEQLSKVLAGNVSFGQSTTNTDQGRNINGWMATGTSPAGPNTEFAVAHGLGRIPIGFFVLSTDKAAHIYKSTTAWTTSNIYLKSDVASVTYTLFIV